MKVSKKDIYLIIGFLGVLAFLCAFLWVYQPTMEKVDALKGREPLSGNRNCRSAKQDG